MPPSIDLKLPKAEASVPVSLFQRAKLGHRSLWRARFHPNCSWFIEIAKQTSDLHPEISRE